MRAAVCRAFGEPLVIEDLRLDPIGPAEVRVEVAACAICHSDIHYADGSWGGALPAVYGHEAAGTVTETGDRVSDVTVGDRVAISLIRSCGNCVQCQRGYEVFCESRWWWRWTPSTESSTRPVASAPPTPSRPPPIWLPRSARRREAGE